MKLTRKLEIYKLILKEWIKGQKIYTYDNIIIKQNNYSGLCFTICSLKISSKTSFKEKRWFKNRVTIWGLIEGFRWKPSSYKPKYKWLKRRIFWVTILINIISFIKKTFK